jgi:hypothetical protein
VKRIQCLRKEENVYVLFSEYKDRKQIKDFYKLFKKGSGISVIEYNEQEDRIEAVTKNETNSVRIEWNTEYGCFIYANGEDIIEFYKIVYKMLCYRYKAFSKYKDMFDGILQFEKNENIEKGDREDLNYNNDDSDIISEMNELINMMKRKN